MSKKRTRTFFWRQRQFYHAVGKVNNPPSFSRGVAHFGGDKMRGEGRYLHEVKTSDGRIKYFDNCGDAFGFFCCEHGIYDRIVWKTYKEVPPLYS